MRRWLLRNLRSRSGGFNPRTPAGCDTKDIDQEIGKYQFQSTHPCGVRRKDVARKLFNEGFQSTHPCGVRQIPACLYCLTPLFQSTHPCGVRLGTLWAGRGIRSVSIHAPLRGATRILTGIGIAYDVSIHAPLRGATAQRRILERSLREFQSTHPCGVRRRLGCSGRY